ncbi:serine protease [Thermosipho melanesiensis]|uniref:Protease Do n=2 Tax=Thermosipho melanesiensis TaxID=46541 RepID=A6LNY1_THEM4|nr:Do family serine endopeptidase [Thermosipho melanesiensis]ABR31632.1 protease Do [Thermosipho melanesiensis BI429]APT74661.1 serine protease [Thermosipho melanesiensis]OOC35160.1 serine protease [Thermosipho melanesiensis]OOC35370.1 serine protease [Thermosipho melanesiensis]OOC36621.1 serine protease [Thermosipho melanesiensis]
MTKRLGILILTVLAIFSFGYVNPNYESPITKVVDEAAPAVVKIEATVYSTSYIDPFIEEFFKRWFGDIPKQYQQKGTSLGSGFIFEKEGYILTNFHVVDGAENIKVSLLDGKEFSAEFIGGDKELDIAILKIDPKNQELPVLEFGDSDKLKIGEWAIAIGNPLGFQHTVTVGVISATGRKIPKPDNDGYYTNLIQTDAAINPGNSGGPLLNIHGQVIGINTAIIAPSEAMNIGFAIPINTAKRFIDSIIKTGKAEKAYLGVYMQTVTKELAKALGLKTDKGVFISQVIKDSPAEKAGLKDGDVIIEVEGLSVTSASELKSIIHNYTPGSKIKIIVNRKGKIIKFEVTLGKSKETEKVTSAKEFMGLTVKDITNADREEYQIPEEISGVVVKNSKISYISEGYVIFRIAINGQKYEIRNINDWNKVISKINKGNYVALFYYYKGATGVFSFGY